tara:strand:+ start:440 stop:652 length:213 start_codon:yes stop_codon:yes gene_type:complete
MLSNGFKTLKSYPPGFWAQVNRIPRNIIPIPTKDHNRGTSPKRENAIIDDNTGSKRIRVDNIVGETNLTT